MPRIRSPTTPPYYDYRDEFGRRRSTPALSTEHGASEPSVEASRSHPNIISPPASPTVPRSRKTSSSAFSQHLRSNSGLALHMNEDALRKYTDYNADGTSRGPLFKPFSWQSREGDSADSGRRGLILDEAHEWKLPIPDVFGLDIFQMVLKDPSAAAGLLKYSRESGYGIDMAYLAKVSINPGPETLEPGL